MAQIPQCGIRSIALIVALFVSCAEGQPPAAMVPFTPRPLSRIEPGTVITDRAPAGWSQLVIKSQPKVNRGDVAEVSKSTIELASLFFNAILVKVGKQDDATQRAGGRPRFGLERVAIGLGTRVDGKDTIISSATADKLGAKLGLIAGMVLSKSEEQLSQIVEIARSPTMAIVDSPANWVRDGKHVPAVVRYAFLVDPRDGRAYTLVWLLDKQDDSYRLAAGPLVLMRPNLVADCDMHVDASKFTLGIPSADAFAVTRLPPGVQLAMPEPARVVAALRRLTPALAHQLEVGLWSAIFPDPASSAIMPR
jgi:hypothetical protein